MKLLEAMSAGKIGQVIWAPFDLKGVKGLPVSVNGVTTRTGYLPTESELKSEDWQIFDKEELASKDGSIGCLLITEECKSYVNFINNWKEGPGHLF